MSRPLDMLELSQLLMQVLNTFDGLLSESETTEDFTEVAQTYLRESAVGLSSHVRSIYMEKTMSLLSLYQARLLKQDEQQAAAQVVMSLQQVRTRLEQVVIEGMALHDGPYLDAVVAMYNAVLDGLQELSALSADAADDARTHMQTTAAGLLLDKQLQQTETPVLQCLSWLKAGVDLPKAWLADRLQQWSVEEIKA